MVPIQAKRSRVGLGLLGAAGLLELATNAGIAGAAPITYEIHRSIDSSVLVGICGVPGTPACFTYTLDGTVTTDGTLGGWGGTNHILDIQLVMSDGTHSASLDDVFIGTSASATSEQLLVSFGSVVTFRNSSAPDSRWTFCATQRTACTESASLAANGLQLEDVMRGTPTGTTAAYAQIPEPSVALLAGLGLGWLSARRSS